MKIRRNRINANKRPIKCSSYDSLSEAIELARDAYLDAWIKDYTGTPNTSWNNIFDNAKEEFILYCGDEASAESDMYGTYGDTLEDMFVAGLIDEDDLIYEFDQWLMWRDLSEFDV